MKYNMKKIFSLLLMAASLSSCSDYLDITPKGQVMLEEVDDIEKLLNSNYESSAWTYDELNVLTNESYGRMVAPANVIAGGNGIDYIHMSYNDQIDRLQYAAEDNRYAALYTEINYRNVVIQQLQGKNDSRVAQLTAEARMMRAYFHYLLVNIYAKQYDSATAESEGGIPYVTNTTIGDVKQKLSLAETYEQILADCADEVIADLPDKAVNISRPGKAFGYALRSKVLFQMKRYAEAQTYAERSLALQDQVDDRTDVIGSSLYYRDRDAGNNLLYGGAGTMSTAYMLSVETSKLLPEGDILKLYGRSDLTGDNKEIWNTFETAAYANGLDGTVYVYFNGSNAMLNLSGVTCEQMHYLHAECLIRAGQIKQGLDEVNAIRKYRIAPEYYQDLTATTEQDAMNLLRDAKWIECLFTYNNFFDMKRWNSEAANRRTITRTVSGKTYSLAPDSPLWVFPFPKTATDYNPTLTQNF